MCIMHTTCAAIFLNRFDAEGKDIDTLTNLAEMKHIIGRPQGGEHAGRFPNFPYESIGNEKVDLRPYWTPGREPGSNTFDWQGVADKQGLAWVFSRPDV
jgi:hypothetical protein